MYCTASRQSAVVIGWPKGSSAATLRRLRCGIEGQEIDDIVEGGPVGWTVSGSFPFAGLAGIDGVDDVQGVVGGHIVVGIVGHGTAFKAVNEVDDCHDIVGSDVRVVIDVEAIARIDPGAGDCAAS